ncbi:MAG TPA: ABC transporter substrate-binding protein, partial [Mycobacterium sp.]|nr:ABC transporter substrate-binding protein [Mycobacterium sp.]
MTTSSVRHRGRRSARRTPTMRRCAVLIAVVALAAACTESKGQADNGGSATGTVPTTVAGTKAAGTPVKIGFTNTDTGATALPQVTAGAKLAAENINAHDNGINGHPIELVTCSTDGTPESSAACANKLVTEKVVAVIDAADVGTDAKLPILRDAGIATMGTITLGTSQALNQDAFFFSPPITTYPRVEIDLAAAVGAKKITLLFPDIPQVPL